MCDDDDVQVVPRDVLIREVSEHGGDERCCSVVHVQARLSLRKSDWLVRRAEGTGIRERGTTAVCDSLAMHFFRVNNRFANNKSIQLPHAPNRIKTRQHVARRERLYL